ncbi:hypothetical protein CEXT_634071 [Caerostris extrusa]|uniref:Uncharacterized protein n=1 Tax=Caerostris extrusa TaxID=172846 RepID=A0AAV4RIG1_CAEEX|nr:hypothetical protein CEXT_634071 [Caerostris extrusa]
MQIPGGEGAGECFVVLRAAKPASCRRSLLLLNDQSCRSQQASSSFPFSRKTVNIPEKACKSIQKRAYVDSVKYSNARMFPVCKRHIDCGFAPITVVGEQAIWFLSTIIYKVQFEATEMSERLFFLVIAS